MLSTIGRLGRKGTRSTQPPRFRTAATFTSSHFRLDASTITAYLERRGLGYRDTPTHYVVRTCPLCPKPHKDSPDNLYKLYVRKIDGTYFCHRCGKGGSWFDLKAAQGDIPQVVGGTAAPPPAIAEAHWTSVPADDSSLFSSASVIPSSSLLGSVGGRPAPSPTGDASLGVPAGLQPPIAADMRFVQAACDDLLVHGRFPAVLNYLTGTRGLTLAVLREYRVGAARRWFAFNDGRAGGEEHDVVVFPWLELQPQQPHGAASVTALGQLALDPLSPGPLVGGPTQTSQPTRQPSPPQQQQLMRCVRIKLRSVTNKACQQMLPKGGSSAGMFGLHLLPPPKTGSVEDAFHGWPAEQPALRASAPSPIVITEGEYDALAVRQATGYAAASLPKRVGGEGART